MRQRQVEIKGLCVSLYALTRDLQHRQSMIRRKIVSPEWTQLWFLINDNQFDVSLWGSLNTVDKDFLALCVHQCHINNPSFETQLGRDFRNIYERMRIIEGSIVAGNLNRALVDEFKEIVERLSASHQIPKKQATNLRNRIERTYAATSSAVDAFDQSRSSD